MLAFFFFSFFKLYLRQLSTLNHCSGESETISYFADVALVVNFTLVVDFVTFKSCPVNSQVLLLKICYGA